MSICTFVTRPWVMERLRRGPLGQYIDTYAARLAVRGYVREIGRRHLTVIADLSRYLRARGLGAGELDERIVKSFLRCRRRYGRPYRTDRSALRAFLAMLREIGASPAPIPMVLSPAEKAIDDFQRHLLQERGLARSSIGRMVRTARRFLRERCHRHEEPWATMTAEEVIGFVECHAHDHSPGCARNMCTSLRAFLRYLQYRGEIKQDLANAVPRVAQWKFTTLPRFISPQQVQQVLDRCDRSSALGKRDYAILMLLARLGLRAGEIAGLRLEDIDWHSGQLYLRHTKSGASEHMPLPAEVGRAVVSYLKHGRPPSSDRHVFLRHCAPRRGLTGSQGVYWVARRALARANVEAPTRGAHLFRHTLATQILRNGASLALIAQLLRHQHPDTTRIYAKVDLARLRTLALPWPGGAS